MANSTIPTEEYERRQSFNAIVKFLHGVRYRNLVTAVTPIAAIGQIRVVDIGCAGAKVFAVLSNLFDIQYVGIESEISRSETAHARFGHASNFRVIHGSIEDHVTELNGADVIVALEAIEHLPDQLAEIVIGAAAEARPRLFICSVPNEVGPIIWVKNIGSVMMGYMRHKEYKWRETLMAGLFRFERHDTGHKGFDWRRIDAMLRQKFVVERRSSPFEWLPSIASPSIFFAAKPRQKTR
ncbi:class I SAM-dependent methyltransferase [Xanthobacteraceae bacterium Astr-EGSB]|uniref:class I SAM-dependent methyltransferase n=1 Tax=Astrobacterium formosum TaxID=3069710 RepID=UPI0027AF81C8|nr:class I SAM-dependent methyltransferase [Xanthobacteraceae bacterium Astr-EGSB]